MIFFLQFAHSKSKFGVNFSIEQMLPLKIIKKLSKLEIFTERRNLSVADIFLHSS